MQEQAAHRISSELIDSETLIAVERSHPNRPIRAAGHQSSPHRLDRHRVYPMGVAVPFLLDAAGAQIEQLGNKVPAAADQVLAIGMPGQGSDVSRWTVPHDADLLLLRLAKRPVLRFG